VEEKAKLILFLEKNDFQNGNTQLLTTRIIDKDVELKNKQLLL
jgi:hypothetical protein